MGDMPFNIHENAIYGHPLGPHFSDNVRSLRHLPDRSNVALVERYPNLEWGLLTMKLNASFKRSPTHEWTRECGLIKEAQLVAIRIWWQRAIRNSPKRLKTQRRVKRRPLGMGQKVIQLRLERAKGIPTALVLTDKWRSNPNQLKTQTHLCVCHGQNRSVLVKNPGGHNGT